MISSKMRGVLCLACLTVGLSAQTATPSGGYGLHEGADNVSAAEPGGDPIDLVIDPATDSTPTPGTTHYVSLAGANRSPYTNWTDAATSIAAALQVAIGDGDTVLVAAGTYALPSQLVLEHGVVLRSVDGAASTVVDAEQNSRCFLIQHADAVIDGFTITGGEINSDNGTSGFHLVNKKASGLGWTNSNYYDQAHPGNSSLWTHDSGLVRCNLHTRTNCRGRGIGPALKRTAKIGSVAETQ